VRRKVARILSKKRFFMAMYAQILSAIFALIAASLWLGVALVRTPRNFSVQVKTWHTHNFENVDGSETAGGGHGTSDELETFRKRACLSWCSFIARLSAPTRRNAQVAKKFAIPKRSAHALFLACFAREAWRFAHARSSISGALPA
jgi:hypothetical protein